MLLVSRLNIALCSGLYKVYPTNLKLSTLLLYISPYSPLIITTTTTALHLNGRKVINDDGKEGR